MPSKKILGILVVCASIVFSVWIINKSPSSNTGKEKLATVKNYSIETKSSEDWKKTIESFSSSNQAYIDLTKSKGSETDQTTITGQVSVDFMSKYLIAKQDGVVSSEEMKQITDSIVNSNTYIKPQPSIYTPSNLNIINKDDLQSLQQYQAGLNLIVKNGLQNVNIDPLFILYTSLKTDAEDELVKLDPIIKANKDAILKLLEIPVPQKVSTLHLNFLNILGKTLDDFQSMRNMFNDPIKGLQAANDYNNNVKEFIDTLTKINTYLESRLDK